MGQQPANPNVGGWQAVCIGQQQPFGLQEATLWVAAYDAEATLWVALVD